MPTIEKMIIDVISAVASQKGGQLNWFEKYAVGTAVRESAKRVRAVYMDEPWGTVGSNQALNFPANRANEVLEVLAQRQTGKATKINRPLAQLNVARAVAELKYEDLNLLDL